MTDRVSKLHFRDLAAQDPETVCRRAKCTYDQQKQCYAITVWGDPYAVYPYEGRIECCGGNTPPHGDVFIFIIHYLLTSASIEPVGNWISEKDFPGGTTFFRGPHEIPTRWIAASYGGKLDAFRARCELLGGISLNMSDAGFAFQITPRISVAVLFWDGDEEFPSAAKLLFDRSLAGQLALDIIYALAVTVCAGIANRDKDRQGR